MKFIAVYFLATAVCALARAPTLMWSHPEDVGTGSGGRLLLDEHTLKSAREPGYEFEVHLPTGLSLIAKSERVRRTHPGQVYGQYHADGRPMFPEEVRLLDVNEESQPVAPHGVWHIKSAIIDSNVPEEQRSFSREETTDMLHLYHADNGRVHGSILVDGQRTQLLTNDDGELVAELPTVQEDGPEDCNSPLEPEGGADLLEQPARAERHRDVSLKATNQLIINTYVECCNSTFFCQNDFAAAQQIEDAVLQTWIGESGILSGGIVFRYACHKASRFTPSTNTTKMTQRLRTYFIGTAGEAIRDTNNYDIIMFMRENFLATQCGSAYVTPFYKGTTNWSASGANKNLAFGCVKTSCSAATNSMAHELGHIMGFRHNRRADNTNANLENHGGGRFITFSTGNRCTPTVMSVQGGAKSVCATTGFTAATRANVLSTPSLHFDHRNGVFNNNVNNRRRHLNSLVEIAKYY